MSAVYGYEAVRSGIYDADLEQSIWFNINEITGRCNEGAD